MVDNSLPPGFSLDQDADTGEAGSLPSGFQLDEEKYGGLGGEAKAALAGAARGASFGLSDQALVHSGLVKPETLQGLKEENPASSIGGEAAGVIVPALFGDEAGVFGELGSGVKAVSKLGGAVEKGVASALPGATTLTGKMARGALSSGLGLGTEGAAYGLGQSISEDALGDHDLISQHTLSNMGLSAAFAGGIGSALGAGMGAIGRDASSQAEKLLAQKLAETAPPGSGEEALLKSGLPAEDKIGFIDGLTKQKENAAEIRAAGDLIGAPVLPAQTSASDYVQSMTSALSQSPTIPGVQTQQTIQRGFDAVKNVLKDSLGSDEHLTPFEAGGKIKDQISNVVDQMYAPIKASYKDLENTGKTIELTDEDKLNLSMNLLEKAQSFGSVGSKGSKLIEHYADRALSQGTSSNLDELMNEISGEQRAAFRSGDTHSSKALGLVNDELREFQLQQTIKKAKFIAGDEGEELAKSLIKQAKDTDAAYSEFKETLNGLASDSRLGKKLKTHGTVESVLDAIPNEKIVGKMFDPKNSAGLAKLQEKFPEVFDTLVQHKKSEILSASMKDGAPDVNKVLKELDKLSPEIKGLIFKPEELAKLKAAKTWVESLPRNVGPSGTPKGISFMDALKNPVSSILGNAKDYGISKLLKFSSPAEANKVMLLVNAEKQGISGASQIKGGVAKILERSINAAKPIAGWDAAKLASIDDYKDKTKEIASIANNPQSLHDKVSSATEGVYGSAPKLASALQQSMVRGITYLNSKIPAAAMPGPFSKPIDPSKADVSKFNRYYTAVENPMSVLKQLHDHTLTQESLEALQIVHPKIYNQMKTEVLNQVTKMKSPERLPYQTKMVLSKFLGQPIHPSQTAQSIATNQAVYNQAPQNQPQKPQKSNQAGLSKLSLGSRLSLSPNDEGNIK